MNRTETVHPRIDRIQQGALIVGVVGLVICLISAFITQRQFFQSYLFGYIFWIHLALGCIALVMLHHLTGGRWGFPIRRFLESASMTLPLMALLFIPLLFGLQELYLWARPEELAESELLSHKLPYLNVPFFVGRTIFYFVVWGGLAYLLNRWSHQQDETADPALTKRLRNLSAFGLVLYFLTATFAAFDWMMSLDPRWFSSIYGVIFIAGQAVATMAFVLILSAVMSSREPLSGWLSIDIFNDLGNFLLTFVSFWAYVSFSQYLIIWSANLPETVTWYLHRTNGGWQWLALALIFFQFAIPFLILLSRRAKRNVKILASLAVFLVLIRFVDLFWMIMPSFYEQGFHIHWLDFITPVAIGGLWIAFFIWQLKRKPLLPWHDPRLQEVSAHD